MPEYPDFGVSPTKTSIGTGFWDVAGTWTPSGVPGLTDRVKVAAGHTVTIRNTAAQALLVAIDGILTHDPVVTTQLKTGIVQVNAAGRYRIGTTTTPVAVGQTATLLLRNIAVSQGSSNWGGSGVADVEQHGTGLLVAGALEMHGAVKTPWIRLAAAVGAGATSLTLASPPAGWRPGDRLVLPKTQRTIGSITLETWAQNEVVTIANVAGGVVTLTAPTQSAHPASIVHTAPSTTDYFSTGNLTRNVIVVSETPSGTRGHCLFVDAASVDLRYVTFLKLGRTTFVPLNPATNHIGRYPIHFHHLLKPPALITVSSIQYRGVVIGCAVEGSSLGTNTDKQKWGIALHDSHWNLFNNNVIYAMGGAGFQLEDGNEYKNTISNNWISLSKGDSAPIYDRRTFDPPEYGFEGSGIWIRSGQSTVDGNIVSNVQRFAYVISQIDTGIEPALSDRDGDVNVPTSISSDALTLINVKALPLISLANNEAFGAMEAGFTFWEVGAHLNRGGTLEGIASRVATGRSTITGAKVFNVSQDGLEVKHASDLDFVSPLLVGDKLSKVGAAFSNQDRLASQMTIQGGRIVGFKLGIECPHFAGPLGVSEGTLFVTDLLVSNAVDVECSTPRTDEEQFAQFVPRRVVLTRVVFSDVTAQRTKAIKLVAKLTGTSAARVNTVQLDRLFVAAYNGVAGDDFQAFYLEQAPTQIVPQTTVNVLGAPAAGLTNTQALATYGVAIAGAIWPAGVVDRALIEGKVLPLGGAPAAGGRVSWAELEIPNAGLNQRSAYVSWVEVEVPDVGANERSARVSWTECEVPPAPIRTAQVSWIELEVPVPPVRAARVSWGEVEVPTAGANERGAQVSWTELEIPNASPAPIAPTGPPIFCGD